MFLQSKDFLRNEELNTFFFKFQNASLNLIFSILK